MKIFLKVLNYFFVTLGVIFFILILVGFYLYTTDPFGIRQFFSSTEITPSTILEAARNAENISGNTAIKVQNSTGAVVDKNPLLSPEQEKTLEAIGVDPAALPTAITPEMEGCFIQKLGEARINEITNGSEPTPLDFFKINSCLK